MIVFPDRRLLIMAPPHTASRALHYACCEQLRAIWRDGPSPDGSVVDHHTNTIGAEFTGWKRAVVVRNPFTRIVGLWFHLVDWCRYNGDGCCGFREFVRMVHADDAEHLSWMYRYTISRWLADTAVDAVLRYETLGEDLERLLGEPLQLREPVQRMRRDVVDYYDAESLRRVAEWGTQDSATWEYTPPCR